MNTITKGDFLTDNDPNKPWVVTKVQAWDPNEHDLGVKRGDELLFSTIDATLVELSRKKRPNEEQDVVLSNDLHFCAEPPELFGDYGLHLGKSHRLSVKWCGTSSPSNDLYAGGYASKQENKVIVGIAVTKFKHPGGTWHAER